MSVIYITRKILKIKPSLNSNDDDDFKKKTVKFRLCQFRIADDCQ